MNIRNIISISEARKNIFQIADDVQKPDNHYTLTENGRPKMVILSADEFASWLETVEVLNTPEIMKEIKSSKTAYKSGGYVSLRRILQKESLKVSDNNDKYVPGRTKKISTKKPAKNRKKL